jgi:uncharacterized membrane protein
MNDQAKRVTGLAVGCAFAAALGIVASNQGAGAADEAEQEKCYGVAKAGGRPRHVRRLLQGRLSR